MGRTITCATEMLSYAGELRRQARRMPEADLARKVQTSADRLEKTAIGQVAKSAAPGIGALLDTFV